jgi:LysM repeat protein
MLLRIFVIMVLAGVVIGACWFAVHELYIKPEQQLRTDKALPPPLPPPDPSLADFAKCEAVHGTGDKAASRTALEQFLREYPASVKRDAAYDMLGEINSAEFFAARPGEANTYIVQRGDSVSRVASRTKVSVELIIYLNKIDARFLQPNQRLLVPPVAFRLVIQQKARRLVLYNGDKFFRQYPAAAWPGGDKPVIHPKQTGRVTEKRATDSTGSVTPEKIRYFAAYHIILINIPGHSLHTQPNDPKAGGERPPGGGIGVAPEHMNEIAILLPSGAPVSME